MLDTDSAISDAFSTAVVALSEAFVNVLAADASADAAEDVVSCFAGAGAAAAAAAARPERSTLFTRFESPLITDVVLDWVTRLPEPSTRPAAKSL